MLVFESEVNELMRRNFTVRRLGRLPSGRSAVGKGGGQRCRTVFPCRGVSISSDPERAYQVSLSKPRRSSVHVDQLRARLPENLRSGFFMFMFRTHRWLLDKCESGK